MAGASTAFTAAWTALRKRSSPSARNLIDSFCGAGLDAFALSLSVSFMNRPRRLCIFCGEGNLSKEHFWPQWMEPLLPSNTTLGEKVTLDHPINGLTVKRDVSRPASMTTLKFRVVCNACNNGWMNRLETAARPHLTKMVDGKRFVMNDDEQLTVARWCAAKVMVAEHAPEMVPMTPEVDRRAMMERLSIPNYYRIYACAHSCEARLAYQRRSSVISLSPTGPVPGLDGMARNVQQVSFLIGRTMIHVNAARLEGFQIEDRFSMPIVQKHMRIFPQLAPRRKWPGMAILSAEQVRVLSNSLEIIGSSAFGIWSRDTAI